MKTNHVRFMKVLISLVVFYNKINKAKSGRNIKFDYYLRFTILDLQIK